MKSVRHSLSYTTMKSILQTTDECYVCRAKGVLHTHEVFFGSANRKKSIKWGCQVRLCPKHHNMSSEGVHMNRALDLRLKRECQRQFELLYGHELFMQEFKKNYEND